MWCQNHDYALNFASGIVMVLTSPRAYKFNCAPQSSQYLYIINPEKHDWLASLSDAIYKSLYPSSKTMIKHSFRYINGSQLAKI